MAYEYKYIGATVYVGANNETVEWSQVSDATSWDDPTTGDDGSAAHEPVNLTDADLERALETIRKLRVQPVAHDPAAQPIACGRSAQNWLAQARLFTSPADARPEATAVRVLEAECDRLRALVRSGVNVDPGDTFGGHLIWWPDELPVPLAVGEQGSRVMKMPESASNFTPEVRSMVNNNGLLNAVEETTSDDPVRADVERTIDHLQRHLVRDKEFGDLKRAVEQAGRTNGKSDAAINDIRGRALR